MKIVEGREAEYEQYVKVNDDPYSARVVSYGREWADMMEALIEKGAKLEEIADQTSHDADTDGITGYMHGAAVLGLAHFWVHGDALRVWHNAKHGVTEDKAQGGTVNPAILTIG